MWGPSACGRNMAGIGFYLGIAPSKQAMSSKQRMPWVRIGAEGLTIIASILLAFAIDAWWTNRVERDVEAEELARLYDEFSTNRTRIGDSGWQGGAADPSLSIFEMIDEALRQGIEVIDVPDELLAGMIDTPTFEAETPVLDGLVQSGRISIIQDRAILAALSIWERLLRNATDQDINARNLVHEQLIPALIEHGDVGDVIVGKIAGAIPSEGATSIRVDEHLKGLVAQRFERTARVRFALSEAEAAADQVLAAISAAQDD